MNPATGLATARPAGGFTTAPAPLWRAASGAVAMRLADGPYFGPDFGPDTGQDSNGWHSTRWHFQHGPIDLMIGADGTPSALAQAVKTAWQTFADILPVLAAQLAQLRQPVRGQSRQPAPLRVAPFVPRPVPPRPALWSEQDSAVQGETARRMLAACRPYADHIYLTPMAAVAGAVADTVICAFAEQPGIHRAYVNNGGDIALHLSAGTHYRVGLYDMKNGDMKNGGHEPGRPARALTADDLDGRFVVSAASAVRGLATSGWRGRSFSLGIADSVTVLAARSAWADAAATVIANQVDVDSTVDHPAIARAPACELKDDSDLGSALVTTRVGCLPDDIVRAALARGEQQARYLLAAGLIEGAALCLQGQRRIVLNEKKRNETRQDETRQDEQAAMPHNAGMLDSQRNRKNRQNRRKPHVGFD